MKKTLSLLLITFAFSVHAQTTSFVYQGRLSENGVASNSTNDFRFRLYSDNVGNSQVSSNVFADDIVLTNGLFTVSLDFGAAAFDGSSRWLEIAIRPGTSTGPYTPVSPLQPVTSSPYAVRAASAGVADSVTGNISDSQLSANIPRLNGTSTFTGSATFNNAVGNFSGNGTGLTNVNASSLNGLTSSAFWKTGGNSATAAGVNFVGTTDNQPLELKVNSDRALRLEPGTNATANLVGGSSVNQVDAGVSGATIAGGGVGNYFGSSQPNRISGDYSVIGGGRDNSIQAGSGQSVIGGGLSHIIRSNASSSVVGGGYLNIIDSNAGVSTISGGGNNLVQSSWSTISGGDHNTVGKFSNQSAIGGGSGNTIQLNDTYSVIGGGYGNLIQSNAWDSVIDGGNYNAIEPDSIRSVIGGGYWNRIATNSPYSVIGGGNQNSITNSTQATIGGGSQNVIQTNSQAATIGGGLNNKIVTNSFAATIAGGANNTVNGALGTVTGGANNSVLTGGGAIVGGDHNEIWSGAGSSFIAGGRYNVIMSNSMNAVIGGGYGHYLNPNSDEATIAGGRNNIVFSGGTWSAIAGGYGNYSTGPYAILPGGDQNTATTNSLAAGHRAKANHKGSFVWADSTEADFATTGTNQFLIRAKGIGINTNNPQSALHVNGTVTATAFAGSGSGLTSISASSLAGTISDTQLSTNVALLNTSSQVNQSFQGSHIGLGGPVSPTARVIAYDDYGNPALKTDSTGITLGDFNGYAFGNYLKIDFENTPKFTFSGAPVDITGGALSLSVGDVQVSANNNFKYASAKTHYYSVPAAAFHLENSSVCDRTMIGGTVYTTGGSAATVAYFVAPVNLPDGATLTAVTFYQVDNDATYNPQTGTLWRNDASTSTSYGNALTMATVPLPASSNSTLVQTSTTSTITNPVIDNQNYTYWLRWGTQQANSNLRLVKVLITYTVTKAD